MKTGIRIQNIFLNLRERQTRQLPDEYELSTDKTVKVKSQRSKESQYVTY